jgi:DNA-binding transcriptional ArsR family regulator
MQLDTFQTLADPSRRQIVDLLRRGELPVNDMVAELAIHQSGVSRHLRILLDAGFVQMRPDGQRRLYSLRSEPFVELDAWLDGYRALWEARIDRFGKALETRQRARKAKPPKEKKR